MNKNTLVKMLPILHARQPQLAAAMLPPLDPAEDFRPDPDRTAVAAFDEGTKIKKKKKTPKSKKNLGSARGIETMFRTAYRAQLDLTALSATKANIMISLNGLILSVLTISGPFVLVAEPMFTAPIAVFLATCLASIIFAVLAASPRFTTSRNSVEDFTNDKANILVFEQFSALDMSEHSEAMTSMMCNKQRIYKNMSRQLYLLGVDANRKFRLLKFSYMSFLAGLTASTVMLLAVGMIYHTHDMSEILASLQNHIPAIHKSL